MALGGLMAAGAATGAALNKIFDYTEKAFDIKDNFDRNTGKTSLARVTAISRVEPLCIIDSDCIHLEYISDVINSLQSVFSGYYLQAVSLMGTVSGVHVARELDKLNPSRDPKVADFFRTTRDSLGIPYKLDQQSYKWALPTKTIKASLEADKDYDEFLKRAKLTKQEEAEAIKDAQNRDRPATSEKEFLALNELANLSSGRLLNVTISKNGQALSVPIAIRLLVNELRPATIVKMFGKGELDRSFTERYYKWKAGRISFFNDLILCRDLIKEHKKSLMEDRDEVLTEIHSRANKNLLAGLISKQPSVATSSNLYVISESTATAIKRSSGLDITNFSQRQKLFEETYAMILVVIDREYQRINFYHDNIRLPTSVGVRDIRNSNKDSGPSIMDILAAYKQGQSPTL